MLYLALGYFLAYIPYAILTKALSSGIVPGIDAPVGGLVLLPASAIGQLLTMLIVLRVSGWWRSAREQQIKGRRITLPRRDTMLAGFFTAVVIGTTTLNFTFLGVSILSIYCMTAEHCAAVIALAPEVAERTHRLDPAGDIPEPSATSLDEHRHTAGIIGQAVRRRFVEQSVAVA